MAAYWRTHMLTAQVSWLSLRVGGVTTVMFRIMSVVTITII